jgi:hypothetical protein
LYGLASATYKPPLCKSFACHSYKNEGQRAGVLCFPASCVCADSAALLAPSSQRNPLDFGYNLRFALLTLGPTSEVSG